MSEFSDKVKAGDKCSAQLNLASYIPEGFDEHTQEYRHGFIEACITMMMRGILVPDNEKN